MFHRYSEGKLNACLDILRNSPTYPAALARIGAEVDSGLDRTALGKLFKRAGLMAPSSYVHNAFTSEKVSAYCPPVAKPGVSAFKEPWGIDEILYEHSLSVDSFGGVARGGQQPDPGQLLKVLIVPDVHVPYHSAECWETVLTVGREWKPDVAVILGDFCDFYQVSQYPKDPRRKLSFDIEIERCDEEMARFNSLGIPRVVFIEGNHETRYSRLIGSDCPVLSGVRGVASDAKQLLDVQRRFGWEWVPYGHHLSIGKLNFMHDAGHCGVYAAKQSVAAFGASIVFGHTHRAGSHYESTVNGDNHVGWTMGWLGDPECIDYKHRAKVLRENQHGFGYAYVERDTGLFWVNYSPIIKGRSVIDGKTFYGRKGAA